MSRYAPVELLRPDHDTSTFDCGSAPQTVWLRDYGLVAQQSGTARVFVARRSADGRVAGYYALAAGAVRREGAPDRLAAGTGRHPIPVVLLTRLGVDVAEQGRGLGAALVRDALLRAATAADLIGVRAVLIHAESPAAAVFYHRLDTRFEPSPVEPLHLVLLMKDIRAAIAQAATAATASGNPAVSHG